MSQGGKPVVATPIRKLRPANSVEFRPFLIIPLPVEPHPSCRVSMGDFYFGSRLYWCASGLYPRTIIVYPTH